MKSIIKKSLLLASIMLIGLQVIYSNPFPSGDNIGSSLSYGEAVIGHKGNIIEKSLNKKDEQFERGVHNVVPGVYSITGIGMDNINVIESDNGIIVIDGGMEPKDARIAIEMLPKEVAEKPVKAFIYTHWHYVFGAKEWNINEDTIIIAHEQHQSELTSSLQNPTLKDVTAARGAIMLGSLLPTEGPDAPSTIGYIGHIPNSFGGYAEPTHLVGDEEEKFVIDGVEFVTHAGHSDTRDGISIYFPEHKLSIDNIYWAHGMMNLSTLRGDKWREPQKIIDGANWLLSKDIEYSLKVHGLPVSGEVLKEQLTDQNEYIQYLINGTLEGIAKGYSPDELQYAVKLPKDLKESPWLIENYGEFSYHVRRYYNELFHWFGNDSVDLHPLPRDIEAENMVDAMGGLEAVKVEAKEAFDNGEYQWAAQVATYAIRVGDIESKQIKADALRAMAQVATASNTRNWYLTHALILEGKVELPMVLTGEY